jgi:hypothetical protein
MATVLEFLEASGGCCDCCERGSLRLTFHLKKYLCWTCYLQTIKEENQRESDVEEIDSQECSS